MTTILKSLCYGLATLLVLPLVIPERVARKLLKRSVFFQAQGQFLSLLPGKLGYFVRNAYYHYTLNRCPFDVCLHFGMKFTQADAEVGQHVNIGLDAVIGRATLGDYTMMAEGVHILSGKYIHGISDPNVPFIEQPGEYSRVTIGRNCWLGANSVIMADLGDNCIVGAGSIVTKKFPSNKIIMGNPARVVGDTFSNLAQSQQSPDPTNLPTPACRSQEGL